MDECERDAVCTMCTGRGWNKKPTILPVLAAIMHTCVSCFAANDVYVPWITHDRQIFYVLFATLPIPPSHDARACVSVSAVAIIFPASIHIR